MTRKRTLGDAAERRAEHYLSRQGLKCVQRNYQCRLGEIDLIMQEGQILVFVEVRARAPSAFGGGLESVGWHKQQRLIRTARHFLMSHRRWHNAPCRFDVVAVDRQTDQITWLPNAFQVE